MIETSAPVVVEVTVAAGAEAAFETFTADIASWWPVERHSIGEGRVVDVVMEGRAGGRVYERWDDGQERDWADVLEWDPPRRLVLSWHPNPDRDSATEVEVAFEPAGEGTRVRLEHRGWERLGAEADEARTSYETGWRPVLDLFAARCA